MFAQRCLQNLPDVLCAVSRIMSQVSLVFLKGVVTFRGVTRGCEGAVTASWKSLGCIALGSPVES